MTSSLTVQIQWGQEAPYTCTYVYLFHTLHRSHIFIYVTHTNTHPQPLTLSSADKPLSVSFKELHGNWPVTLYMLRVRLKQRTPSLKKHNSKTMTWWCIQASFRVNCLISIAFTLCGQDYCALLNAPLTEYSEHSLIWKMEKKPTSIVL